jgi:hypothetical protein
MNDLEVYKKAISVLGRGENIAVITVISTRAHISLLLPRDINPMK